MIKVLPPKTAEEVIARERERKAMTTLLMALPEEHLAKFHLMADAKEMWEAIKSRFGGNDKSKKMQKYLLKQQFEGFSVSSLEALHKGYDSFDDLYNNLRVFELDVKGTITSSTTTQNMAFVSGESTSSTTNVAMISMRIKKFYKRTGRQLLFDTKDPVGFDKTKVECFNCHKMRHFAKDYRAKGNQDSRRRDVGYNGNKAKDNSRRPAYQEDLNDLVAIDGEDIDCLGHVEEDNKNYAMMAYSNFGSDNKTSVDESDAKTCENASSESVSSVEITTSMPDLVDNTPKVVSEPKVWTDAPIIEEYESDSNDDSVSNVQENIENLSFAFTNSVKHVKSPRENVKETSAPNHYPIIEKDYDFHEKRMAKQAALTKSKKKGTGQQAHRLVGGSVAFGGSNGRITVKGKIKAGSFNLKNIDPSGDLSCLFAKDSIDESNKWHRRLGHVKFKNLNKLVKGNLVRGLPFKIFENDHTCVACQKGKQHKASCPQESNNGVGIQVNDDQGANSEEIDLHDEHFVLSICIPISTAGPLRALYDAKPSYPDDLQCLTLRIFMPVQVKEFLLIHPMMMKECYNLEDVKSVFLSKTIDEEVYVTQPPRFVDPKFPNKVYKVVKALYGLHQAPRAWYATLSTFLKRSRYRRGAIEKTLFIKQDKKDIMLVQVYVDDIIFGNKEVLVKQKKDGIFISQDKYVAKILKKFDFLSVKTASTPIETQKPLVKDEEAPDVDVHLYRSMIGSLMYLIVFRLDIMFAVCACSRVQVTPKTSHLQAVKRIFRYLKGKLKLGLWYPKASSFDLEVYSDSDYVGANLDKKIHNRRLSISWQETFHDNAKNRLLWLLLLQRLNMLLLLTAIDKFCGFKINYYTMGST
nr:hypothetical protein [Tanacetum cinerariifolium]